MDDIVDYLWEIKADMKEQYYIELMNKLKVIGDRLPPKHNKKHLVKYMMKTYICYIDNDDEYKDIKNDVYYGSYEIYNESDDDINCDYERIKEIETEAHFYCYCKDKVDIESYSPFQVLRLIGESKKHIVDNYLNPNVLQEHQREVQDYYKRYIDDWDNWVRIVNEGAMCVTDIIYIGEEDFSG